MASSPMSTRVKHAWEEQDKLVLGLAFLGGWFSKALISMVFLNSCVDVFNFNSPEFNYIFFPISNEWMFQMFTREERIGIEYTDSSMLRKSVLKRHVPLFKR